MGSSIRVRFWVAAVNPIPGGTAGQVQLQPVPPAQPVQPGQAPPPFHDDGLGKALWKSQPQGSIMLAIDEQSGFEYFRARVGHAIDITFADPTPTTAQASAAS